MGNLSSESIKKSASMGNLSAHYCSSSSAAASPNPGSPSSDHLRDPTPVAEGYVSDDPAHASCSSNCRGDRKKGFQTSTERALDKIRFKLRTGSQRDQGNLYVIEGDSSYTILLGKPWIHENCVVPPTLHQSFKYVDENQQADEDKERAGDDSGDDSHESNAGNRDTQKPTEDEVKEEIDLGAENDPRPVFISANLNDREAEEMKQLC
ncbi:uncharacterized protein LOC122066712 [Macadamia integrifolia]|uniref:uncharacterized protein LOC122066712 n=1 Tax=Macadamia integrifolia TaxID=60698 RepID=UPI001C4EA843|nr:uncharacterized protein LOC122066712 [Macadamia integrifolia]